MAVLKLTLPRTLLDDIKVIHRAYYPEYSFQEFLKILSVKGFNYIKKIDHGGLHKILGSIIDLKKSKNKKE